MSLKFSMVGIRKSRVPHVCAICKESIAVGASYVSESFVQVYSSGEHSKHNSVSYCYKCYREMEKTPKLLHYAGNNRHELLRRRIGRKVEYAELESGEMEPAKRIVMKNKYLKGQTSREKLLAMVDILYLSMQECEDLLSSRSSWIYNKGFVGLYTMLDIKESMFVVAVDPSESPRPYILVADKEIKGFRMIAAEDEHVEFHGRKVSRFAYAAGVCRGTYLSSQFLDKLRYKLRYTDEAYGAEEMALYNAILELKPVYGGN